MIQIITKISVFQGLSIPKIYENFNEHLYSQLLADNHC